MDHRLSSWLGLTRSVEDWERSVGDFGRVALAPRVGDVVRYSGGLLSYHVLAIKRDPPEFVGPDPIPGPFTQMVVAERRELARRDKDTPYVEQVLNLDIPFPIWADLVRFACRVETDGAQPQGG